MRKILTTLSICFGMTILGSYAQADQNIREQAIQTVYKIQSGPRFCSAVVIDMEVFKNTILLTAAHCIEPSKPSGFLLDSKGNTITEYKVVKISSDTDLAAIVVPDKNFHPKKSKIAETLVAQEGDEVYAVGYTYGQTRTTTLGILNETVTLMTPLGNMESFNMASPNIDVGNSGGGLFQKNGDNYELIGIASMKGPSVFTSMFVTLDNIKKFIKGE